MTMTKMNGHESNVAAGKSTEMTVARDDSFKLALEPSSFEQALKFAATIAKTGICGVKTAEEVLVRIAAGRELGIGAMQSLRQIYVVNGRPSLDASLILGLCLSSPVCEYFEIAESSAHKATFKAKRRGRPEQVMTWTIEQARAAKLADKDNWKGYPDAMLRARCVAALARVVFPDVLGGFYAREEMEDGAIDTTGTPVNEMTGEVVVDGPQRDYDGEVKAIKARIDDVKETGNRKAKLDLAGEIKASDIPDPWLGQIREYWASAFEVTQ